MSFNLKSVNWGAWSAILALVGVVLFDFLAPQPQSDIKSSDRSMDDLRSEVDEANSKLKIADAEFQRLLWQTSRDEVGPAAMAWVSDTARESLIDMRSFRPQRTERENGVDQLNYLLIAQGSYPSVMEFIKKLESTESLLAVKMVQMGSIDGASDMVRASIGLVAFMEVPDNG